MSTPARWRAGDADREQVAEALRTAHAEGRLGLDEFGERLDAAFAATYVDELEPLTADLPSGGATVEAVRAARRTLPDPRGQGWHGDWQGRHPAWSGPHPAWRTGPAAGPTSYGGSPTPYGRRPAVHGCSGWAGFPGRWVGLLVLAALVLTIVTVAGGSAPWPLLWLGLAFLVVKGRRRTRADRVP